MWLTISVFSYVLIVFVGMIEAEPLTSAAVLGAAGIAAGASALGTMINGWLGWKGSQEQIKEDRRAETLGLKLRGEDIARDEKHIAEAQRFQERGFQSAEQEKRYNKFMNFTIGLNNQLAQNSQLKNNMVNFWKERQ